MRASADPALLKSLASISKRATAYSPEGLVDALTHPAGAFARDVAEFHHLYEQTAPSAEQKTNLQGVFTNE